MPTEHLSPGPEHRTAGFNSPAEVVGYIGHRRPAVRNMNLSVLGKVVWVPDESQ